MSEAIAPEEIKQHLQPYCARFREGREAAGISSLQLGKLLGMSPQAVLQFEKGKQRLDLERFVAACDALHLNVRWVLKGLGEMWEGSPPPRTKPRPARRVQL